MVWPLSSSEAKPKAPDGGVVAPNRSSRQHCWLARDGFFACLDKHQIVDAIREDEKARASCGEELKQFEGACAKAWVGWCSDLLLFFSILRWTIVYFFGLSLQLERMVYG